MNNTAQIIKNESVDLSAVAKSVEGYPNLSGLTTVKLPHKNLVLDGTCCSCAHCGQDLTDAVSIQRGIGPICSKKGYSEDPAEADELQAMIDLAKWPELVEFLTEHYKPLGVRGLINGLVRVASLNRPHGTGQMYGNIEVFSACCDSIENLSYRKLASLLRGTLAVVFVKKDGVSLAVRVRKDHFSYRWSKDVNTQIVGVRYDRRTHSYVFDPDKKSAHSDLTNKQEMWKLLKAHHTGLFLKNPDGLTNRI